MQQYKNYIFYIILILLLLYIVYMQSCKKSPSGTDTVTKQTFYYYDTVVHEYPVLYPVEKLVITPADTVKIPYTDTNYCKQIALDYLSTRYYSDSLKNDSLEVYTSSVVSNNKLLKQKIDYKFLYPVAVTNILPNRIKFYLGGTIGTDLQNLYLGVDATLIDKKDFLYKANIGISPINAKPIYTIGFGYKLSFRKKDKLLNIIR